MPDFRIQIPKQFEDNFKILLKIPKNIIDYFFEILQNCSKYRDVESLNSEITSLIEWESTEIESIVDLFFSISSIHKNNRFTIKETITALINASKKQKIVVSDEDIVRLVAILKYFYDLKVNPIEYLSEAFEVSYKRDHLSISSEIITDIRPIYLGGIEPKKSVILHTLNIEYRNNNDKAVQNLYLAIDTNDMLNLKKQIETALKRHDYLNSNLIETNLSILNYDR